MGKCGHFVYGLFVVAFGDFRLIDSNLFCLVGFSPEKKTTEIYIHTCMIKTKRIKIRSKIMHITTFSGQ